MNASGRSEKKATVSESKERKGTSSYPILAEASIPDLKKMPREIYPLFGGLWLHHYQREPRNEKFLDAAGRIIAYDEDKHHFQCRSLNYIKQLICLNSDSFAVAFGNRFFIYNSIGPARLKETQFNLPETGGYEEPVCFQVLPDQPYVALAYNNEVIIVDLKARNGFAIFKGDHSYKIQKITHDGHNNFIIISAGTMYTHGGQQQTRVIHHLTVDYAKRTAQHQEVSFGDFTHISFIQHFTGNLFLITDNDAELYIAMLINNSLIVDEKIGYGIDPDDPNVFCYKDAFAYVDSKAEEIRVYDLANKKLYSTLIPNPTWATMTQYSPGVLALITKQKSGDPQLNFLIMPRFIPADELKKNLTAMVGDYLSPDTRNTVLGYVGDDPSGVSDISLPCAQHITGITILKQPAILALNHQTYWGERIMSVNSMGDYGQLLDDQLELIVTHLKVAARDSSISQKLSYCEKSLSLLRGFIAERDYTIMVEHLSNAIAYMNFFLCLGQAPVYTHYILDYHLSTMLAKLLTFPDIHETQQEKQRRELLTEKEQSVALACAGRIIPYKEYSRQTHLQTVEMTLNNMFMRVAEQILPRFKIIAISEWMQVAIRYQELDDQSKLGIGRFNPFVTVAESDKLKTLRNMHAKIVAVLNPENKKLDLNEVKPFIEHLIAQNYPEPLQSKFTELLNYCKVVIRYRNIINSQIVSAEQKRIAALPPVVSDKKESKPTSLEDAKLIDTLKKIKSALNPKEAKEPVDESSLFTEVYAWLEQIRDNFTTRIKTAESARSESVSMFGEKNRDLIPELYDCKRAVDHAYEEVTKIQLWSHIDPHEALLKVSRLFVELAVAITQVQGNDQLKLFREQLGELAGNLNKMYLGGPENRA